MATMGQIERPEIRFHDEISSAWETLHRGRTFKARTAAMFGLLGTTDLSGQHWLDAGCGTGTLARLLAARNCNVTGVDASPDMVAAARAHRTDGRLAERLTFRQIPTIESLPFADRAFDGVLCASVLVCQRACVLGVLLLGVPLPACRRHAPHAAPCGLCAARWPAVGRAAAPCSTGAPQRASRAL